MYKTENETKRWRQKQKYMASRRNPGLNQGPLDLQSNALPTELFRLTTMDVAKSIYILKVYLYSRLDKSIADYTNSANSGYFRDRLPYTDKVSIKAKTSIILFQRWTAQQLNTYNNCDRSRSTGGILDDVDQKRTCVYSSFSLKSVSQTTFFFNRICRRSL